MSAAQNHESFSFSQIRLRFLSFSYDFTRHKYAHVKSSPRVHVFLRGTVLPAWHVLYSPIYNPLVFAFSHTHTRSALSSVFYSHTLCSLSSESQRMEAAAPKSPPPESSISVKIAGKLPELIDELLPEIPIKEELIEEVMQELYKEITAGTTTTTATSDCTKPSSPAAKFPTPSLVVGNGKSESCGASVSDSASTVMAGVEFVGPARKTGGSPENGACTSECGWSNNGMVVGKERMDGCDHAGEVDDEWLERVLMSTWGPVDLDPWL